MILQRGMILVINHPSFYFLDLLFLFLPHQIKKPLTGKRAQNKETKVAKILVGHP